MLLPELVDRAQDRVALDFLERVRIFEADLQLVGLADAVGNEIADRELRRAQAVENEPGTGASVPDSAALTISSSGMPSGKFRFTQSAKRADIPFGWHHRPPW